MLSFLQKKISGDTLFGGSDKFFKTELPKSKVYAEYGCGASTKWVLNNTQAKILAVDSDKTWANKVQDLCNDENRLETHWVDLGEVGAWGRPKTYSKHENIQIYTDWIWNQKISPDVVLIDGRFRVCCFLTSLKCAKEGTVILFDDYTNRPHYHIIETFIKPEEQDNRQAKFIKKFIDDEKIY